ncbi:acyl carrier protein [Streptomyces sp. KL2]|uniref:acyl carrier protein n=1 Tax=Streptomyces sp. KL2 TaxID=3050126 RepID=UPI00397A93AF
MHDAPAQPDVRADVLGFLSRYADSVDDIGSDEPLISSGMFDSMVAVQLIDMIQREYGIEVADEDLDIANFDTLDGIQRFVENKRGKRLP